MAEITNCTFTGVKADAEMAEAVVAIANAAQSNAIALQKLAGSIDFSNVQVGPMINMEMERDEDED